MLDRLSLRSWFSTSSTSFSESREPSAGASFKAIVKSSWLNLLLVFIPISWALHFAMPHAKIAIFLTSFFAIIPLASLLAYATDQLSMRVGQTVAGLLNATLGNVVELIVAIIALVKCELRVVQASLAGSILSNLLLVLGMCFFAGGTKFSQQGFSTTAAQINSSLLTLSVTALLLPVALYFSVNWLDVNSTSASEDSHHILKVSHGVAVLLLFTYACYMFFQFRTHAGVYADSDDDSVRSVPYKKNSNIDLGVSAVVPSPSRDITSSTTSLAITRTLSADSRRSIGSAQSDTEAGISVNPDMPAKESPEISLVACLALLAIDTVFVAVTAEWLVDSLSAMSNETGLSVEFISLIMLPIVGNAAEHASAITSSVKDKISLSISVAVGSSIQIALFVIPLLVTLGWILEKPLTLFFDPFETIALFLAVLTVNYIVQDGKSNWLEGMILMVLYIIIGTATFFYTPSTVSLFSCSG